MLWINSLFHHIVIFKHTLGLEIFSFEFNHTLGLEMFSFEFKHTLGLEIFSFEFQYTLGLKCNLGIKQFSFINKGQHLYWQLKMVESVECNEIFTKFTQQQGLKYKISKRSANLTKHPHLKLVIILIIMFCKNPVIRSVKWTFVSMPVMIIFIDSDYAYHCLLNIIKNKLNHKFYLSSNQTQTLSAPGEYRYLT